MHADKGTCQEGMDSATSGWVKVLTGDLLRGGKHKPGQWITSLQCFDGSLLPEHPKPRICKDGWTTGARRKDNQTIMNQWQGDTDTNTRPLQMSVTQLRTTKRASTCRRRNAQMLKMLGGCLTLGCSNA
eukprot:1145143-Pelagomonas_calceolata.AAC.4